MAKEYQVNALQRLTGIPADALASPEETAVFLEEWLLRQEQDTAAATDRLISGFSRLASRPLSPSAAPPASQEPREYLPYLYGNEGKRQAVEQFFLMILQEEKPQTLLLFSDENMAWLYEDAGFAARWAELFTAVILKGNRVKIIHTVSRDMNEMLEAITKWVPIYMTGSIEPYCCPRLRDGIFRRTLFLAPETAAVVSSSVQQNTDGMLNLFLNDREALRALTAEYERYFALCRPLMQIFSGRDTDEFRRAAEALSEAEGGSCLCSAMPPLFTMPEALVRKLAERSADASLLSRWERSADAFLRQIREERLTLVLLDPVCALLTPDALRPSGYGLFSGQELTCTAEEYAAHIAWLRQLEEKHENLKLRFITNLADNTLLYVKEDAGVILAKADAPGTAFFISEKNMISAFRDYIEKRLLS